MSIHQTIIDSLEQAFVDDVETVTVEDLAQDVVTAIPEYADWETLHVEAAVTEALSKLRDQGIVIEATDAVGRSGWRSAW